MNTLANQEALDKILQKYPAYQKAKQTIQSKFDDNNGKIQDQNWANNLGKYNEAVRAVGKQKESELRDLKIKYAMKILNGELT